MKTLFILLLLPAFCLSQLNQTTNLPSIMPSNPQAYQFLKYGEIPVSKYTGVPNINIPIHTIKAKGLDIPITMTYHSNGFKINEEAGWTGLGWSLMAGGSITQIVSGTDDFGRYKYRTMPNFTQIDANFPPSAISSCYPFYIAGKVGGGTGFGGCSAYNDIDPFYISGQFDSQPDVFKFDVLGYSGSFILDWSNNQFVCLSDSNIKIEGYGATPNDFRIITPEGHSFLFRLKEEGEYIISSSKSEEYGGAFSSPDLRANEERAFRTYQLIEIITNQGDLIKYNYGSTSQINGYPSINKQISYYEAPPDIGASYNMPEARQYDVTLSIQATKQKHSYITSIEFNGGSIAFSVSDRLDIVGAKKLSQVKVLNSLNLAVKTFNFEYDYFNGHVNGTNLDSYLLYDSSVNLSKTSNELTKRLKLTSITELGHPPHSFTYNETLPLPKKTSLASDYWGYYNGYLNNFSTFPDIYAFNVHRGNTRFEQYSSNKKASSLEHTKSGVLNQIKYPTGGYTTFQYELNCFDNYVAPPSTQGQLKNFNIVATGGSTSRKVVLIKGGSTIFKGGYLLSTMGCTFSQVYANTKIKIERFKPSLISLVENHQYGMEYALTQMGILNGTNQANYNQYIDEVRTINMNYNDPASILNNDYEIVLGEGLVIFSVTGGCGTYNGTSNSSQASLSLQYKDYLPFSGPFYGAGLRIASIKSYSSTSKLESRKDYTYENGKLMTPLIYAFNSTYKSEWLQLYNTVPNTSCSTKFFFGTKYTLNSSNVAPLSTSANGNFVGYSKVTETNISNAYSYGSVVPTSGKIVTEYTNEPDTNGLGNGLGVTINNQVILPPVKAGLDNGLIIMEEYRSHEDNILKEVSYSYSPVPINKCFYGARYALKETQLTEPSHCWDATCQIYQIGAYPIPVREKSRLDSRSEKDIFAGSNITYLKSFGYDSRNQLNYLNENSSIGDILETYYYYPYNFPSELGYNGMISRNMINMVVKSKRLVNSVPISLTKSIYKYWNSVQVGTQFFPSKYLIEKIQSAKSGQDSDLEDRLIYHNYDNYSNPVEISKGVGKPECYIWGYNGMYPLAKLENIAYSEIPSTLIAALQNASDAGNINNLNIAFDNLRNSPQLINAMITTFEYDPLVGVTSMTDPKGDKVTYDYDTFNRLQFVKDRDGNILSENKYNYRPQN